MRGLVGKFGSLPSRRNFILGGAAVAFGSTISGRDMLVSGADAAGPAIAPVGGLTMNGTRYGSAVRPEYLIHNSASARVIAKLCGFVVPEYHAQWSAIEWQRGKPWFGDLDKIVSFAEANHITMRGHSLIWEQMTPDWARSALANGEGWPLVREHFAMMLTRYDPLVVPDWIVVNECIDTENGEKDYRRTSFQRAFGEDYVWRAFQTAHEIAPAARLYLNEFSLEYDNSTDDRRRVALLRLVEKLLIRDAPIHGVGIQAHLEPGKGRLASRSVRHLIMTLQDMGLDVAITELDVLENGRHGSIERRDAAVADTVREFLDVVNEGQSVGSVATWGLFDQDSWLQDRNASTKEACVNRPIDCAALNRGLPFAADMTAKPMLQSVWTEV